jgi:hypothetical protein
LQEEDYLVPHPQLQQEAFLEHQHPHLQLLVRLVFVIFCLLVLEVFWA